MIPIISNRSYRRASIAAGGGATYADAITAYASLVAYWRLGESTGIVATDEKASHDGTYQPNSGGAWTGGALLQSSVLPSGEGTSAAFSGGSSGRVETSGLGTVFNGASALTMEFWAQRESTGDKIEVGFSAGSGNRFVFQWWNDGNAYTACENGSGNFQQLAASGIGPLHVAVVFDGSQTGDANRFKVYLNGSAQTVTFFGPIPSTLGTVGDFIIGHFDTYATGRIQEVALYNAALSAANVLANYDAGT